VVGVDLGLKKAIVVSDGTEFDAPKPLKKNLRKLNPG
jgi:transposase